MGLFGIGRKKADAELEATQSNGVVELTKKYTDDPDIIAKAEELEENIQYDLEEELDTTELVDVDIPDEEEVMDGPLVVEEVDPEIEHLLFDPTVIGYSSREEQAAVMTGVIPAGYIPQTDSILDVGCGLGDLIAYLEEIRGAERIYYTGIDYNPNMIDLAKTKFPDYESSFSQKDLFDFLDQGPDTKIPSWDWLVAVSSFNIKLTDNMMEYSLSAIDTMLSLANKGIGVNFISQEVEEADPEGDFIKYDPVEMFKVLVEKYPSYHIIIMNNYIDGDFAIHIYKK